MKTHPAKKAFSLTETMIAVAILAVGMIFIAGVFPLGIHFNTLSTERSIAAVVADEAFSKIHLMVDDRFPDRINLVDFPLAAHRIFEEGADYRRWNIIVPQMPILRGTDFFAYPSKPLTITDEQKQYYWSAICRLVDPNERILQTTVFVSRKIGTGTQYWTRDPDPANAPALTTIPQPMPVWLLAEENVNAQSLRRELRLRNDPGLDARNLLATPFVNEGDTIIDDLTGEAYRVTERLRTDDSVIVLDRAFNRVIDPAFPARIWVVPPPVGGGRNPCIAVYQKEIRF